MSTKVHITLDIDMPLAKLRDFLLLVKRFDAESSSEVVAQLIFKANGNLPAVQEIWNEVHGEPKPIQILYDADLVRMLKDSSRGNVGSRGEA